MASTKTTNGVDPRTGEEPERYCGCEWERHDRTGHDDLITIENCGAYTEVLRQVSHLLELALNWSSIETEGYVPPFEWTDFAARHDWTDSATVVRLLTNLKDVWQAQQNAQAGRDLAAELASDLRFCRSGTADERVLSHLSDYAKNIR